MACSKKTMRISGCAWSDGTTTGQYIGFARMSVAEFASARVSVIMEGSSGLLTVTTAAIYGDKESDFGSASPVDFPTSPTTSTADGAVYGASYQALDLSKQAIEIGVKAKNTSGTKMQMGQITLIVDFSD